MEIHKRRKAFQFKRKLSIERVKELTRSDRFVVHFKINDTSELFYIT